MKLSQKQRTEIKAKFGGYCAYCGCVLADKWHVDHVEPVYRDTRYCQNKGRFIPTGKLFAPENDHLGNLMPACVPCNIDKSVLPLEDWRAWLQDKMIASMRKHHPNFRHAERFRLITVSESKPLVFWFEKYNEGDVAC